MEPPVIPACKPDTTIRINFDGAPHTNPSMVRFKDKWIMLVRDKMGPSSLLMVELNDLFIVTKVSEFLSRPTKYKWGAEDPRLFYYDDKLLYTYHGSTDHGIRVVMGEVIQQDLSAANWQAEIKYAPGNEKNWTFFQYRGDKYAVNTFAPKHKVVTVQSGAAYDAVKTDAPAFPWPYGEARGGSPAVRVGEEWYCVFQSHVIHQGMPRYYMGAFAKFLAQKPFKVVAVTEPILTPDEFRDWGYSVVFPSGLFLYKGKWHVSYGHMDNECRIGIFGFEKIETLFKPV